MRRTRALLALTAAAALTATACGSVGGNTATTAAATSAAAPDSSASDSTASSAATESSAASSGGGAAGGPAADTINIGLEQTPGGFNGGSAGANSVYTGYVDNLVHSNFSEIQPDGTILPNETFGTYEKVSDDPLTIDYTIAEEAVWSDGTPIDFDDVLLAWAAFSGSYPSGQQDDAGNDLDLFTPASTNGWDLIQKPTGEPGAKTFSLIYTEPYADWEAVTTGTGVWMPAHIAAEQGGLSPEGDGAALIDAITTDNIAALTPVATYWSTGWDYQPELPTLPDVALLPSSGPYKYDNGGNGTLTVVANDAWWGEPAATPTVVFKTVDAEEWVQAMANGEIDVFDPSNPVQDTPAQLDALGDAVTYETGESYTFSHMDFDSSPEGKLNNPLIRQALLKCIPRQELVDKFAKPIFEGAQVLNLREFLPAQGNYDEILAQVPSATLYDQVDIPGAQALLAEAGVTTPYEIRVIRASTSDLRGQQIAVIKGSCDQAGFNIVDQPDPDVFVTLTTRGTWDAAIFGWSGSGLVASGESIYVSGGNQNYGGYSDPVVDEVWADVVTTTDRDEAELKKARMEEALWTNPYNAVLYANPNLGAWVTGLDGVVLNPTQTGLTWNAETWTKAAG